MKTIKLMAKIEKYLLENPNDDQVMYEEMNNMLNDLKAEDFF